MFRRVGPALARRLVPTALGLTLLVVPAAAQATAPAIAPATGHGPLLLVPMPTAPAWQDLAFLAALPLAAALHDGRPLVLAVAADGTLTAEQRDFVHRLRPARLLWLGSAPADPDVDGIAGESLAAGSAEDAAAALAPRLPKGPRAVVATADDLPGALTAAVLAARLPAPLVFTTPTGLPPATAAALAARGCRTLLLVGAAATTKTTLAQAAVEPLPAAADVARWLDRHGLPVDYLAAAVPADRGVGHVRKLSLVAAVLAAGRRGAVVPLGTATAPPPTAGDAQAALAAFRQALGTEPACLCLCAMPEALPMATVPSPEGIDTAPPSDLSYGNTDADPFVELAVARFVAEDGPAGALLAARCLAYDELLDPTAADRFAMAEWERLAAPLFENRGFRAAARHEGPAPIAPGSPLTAVAAIVHSSHASWLQLGATVHHDSQVLLAPCLVESSGCSAAALDQDEAHRSVALRLLRNGAVAFVGNVRRGVAQGELFRSEFWNAVLAGEPLGRANRHALNCMTALVLARGEQAGGLHRYQLHNAACYGDPAFVLHLPAPARSAAASVQVRGREVTLRAPAQWWRAEACVVPDWKYTAGATITSWRGAGVGADSCWDAAHQRNRDELLHTVAVRTRLPVQRLVAVAPPPAPLGWDGKWSVDEHADGTRSVWFAVRWIDFDMDAGRVLQQVAQLRFRLE